MTWCLSDFLVVRFIQRAVHTDILVTLVREVELQRMGALQLFSRSTEAGIESVWAPITDKWIPESMTILIDLVEVILERLRSGKVIVVVRAIPA